MITSIPWFYIKSDTFFIYVGAQTGGCLPFVTNGREDRELHRRHVRFHVPRVMNISEKDPQSKMSSREMRWQSSTYTPISDGNNYNYTPRTFKSTQSIYRFATVSSKILVVHL